MISTSAVRKSARAILFHEQDVLLIHRRRGSETYHVLPGGGVEAGETPLEACRREVREETGFDLPDFRAVELDDGFGCSTHVFWAEVNEPGVRLGGPEVDRSSASNVYELVWVRVDSLAAIALRPTALVEVVSRVACERRQR